MNAPATQAETGTLTKPVDWAIYMVTAALKCASDEKMAAPHASSDEAKHSILKTLNWFEAHDQYEWPNFSHQNYDFAQAMRLRRALVQDVCNALQQAGSLKIGAPGTPDSVAGRGARRSNGSGDRLMASRKRVCKREANVDGDVMSEHSENPTEDNALPLEVLTDLISRSNLNVDVYLQQKRDSHELADLLHDSLVQVWDGPKRDISDHHDELRQKADLWDRHKRSHPPKSTQHERTVTPRVSPAAVQASPGTVQRAAVGLTSHAWDVAAVEWANANTIG
ncbi:hypothetical protein EKO04_003999 [Ascochyta lentis]|uniref:Uncharacterized protein n=1 Tax=Ascochyta lentis TaxID=205686 RepID=A0A8H7MK72_9PLEO|nr:hypothetical protein EKO04_003999 [Ascochyta lentis]